MRCTKDDSNTISLIGDLVGLVSYVKIYCKVFVFHDMFSCVM